MYPTKRNDNVERITEHTMRHARIHNQLASDKKYAGGLGWCAFDYNTHCNFCSSDRICYHGVSDIFRIPKPAAGFYKSQCDPKEEIVLEPAFRLGAGRPG
jgi:beta-galactosidase